MALSTKNDENVDLESQKQMTSARKSSVSGQDKWQKEISIRSKIIVVWRIIQLIQFFIMILPLTIVFYQNGQSVILALTLFYVTFFTIHVIFAWFCAFEDMESDFIKSQKKGLLKQNTDENTYFCDKCMFLVTKNEAHCTKCNICVEK